MANDQQQMMDIKQDSDAYSMVDNVLRSDELRRKRDEFDKKVERLANKVIDYQQKGPDFAYLTDMLLTFLDVTVQLQSTMEVLSAVNDAMECLTDAIQFIDSSLAYDQDLIKSSLENNYGFFSRLKRRRLIRKAIRNNTDRMMAMVESINGKFGMAMALTDALKISCVKMKSMMDKSRAKSEKRRAKMNKGTGSVPLTGSSSATDAILSRIRKERGIDDAPAAPAAPAGGTPSAGGTTGIDDIL